MSLTYSTSALCSTVSQSVRVSSPVLISDRNRVVFNNKSMTSISCVTSRGNTVTFTTATSTVSRRTVDIVSTKVASTKLYGVFVEALMMSSNTGFTSGNVVSFTLYIVRFTDIAKASKKEFMVTNKFILHLLYKILNKHRIYVMFKLPQGPEVVVGATVEVVVVGVVVVVVSLKHCKNC